jgi:hypothetical protein
VRRSSLGRTVSRLVALEVCGFEGAEERGDSRRVVDGV